MAKKKGHTSSLAKQNGSFRGLMSLQNSCSIPSWAIRTSCDVTVKLETTASCLCTEHTVHVYSSHIRMCRNAYRDQNHCQSNTKSMEQCFLWTHTSWTKPNGSSRFIAFHQYTEITVWDVCTWTFHYWPSHRLTLNPFQCQMTWTCVTKECDRL